MSADMMDVVQAAVAEHPDSAAQTGVDANDGSSDAAETPVETVETPAAETPDESGKTDAAPSEDDELKAIEAELIQKDARLTKGRMPSSRHQAVLTRERRKHEAAIEAERKTLSEKYKPFEDQTFQQKIKTLELAETDPDRFIAILQTLPHYKARLDALVESAVSTRQPAAPKAPAAPEEMPQPDRLNPDGTYGYTAEGVQKLLDWRDAQHEKKLAEREAALSAKLEPVLAKERGAQMREAATSRYSQILTHARNYWEGFQEFEADVQAHISAQPATQFPDLQAAYDAVVRPKLTERRQQAEADTKAAIEKAKREAVEEHIKKSQAKSSQMTSLTPGRLPAASAGDTAGETSMEDVVRQALRAAS